MITSQMQGISMMLSAKTRELNKEKKRTDTLLYQMLPKTIAESLKRNEDVVAELYQDTTIFFSDIVGFTDISSRASPFQVIQMLNSLYTAFDRKIEKYDVFKVETIGDAYMVASGLPCRNGTRHSYEIAIMSLDLLDHISQLEIPHMPDEKFRLRIGVHTGPVAAGVVGLKMPRYCVLGETVSIASRMESLGLPNRIHISITTFDALSNLGGFHMTRRHKLVKQSEHLVSSAGKGDTTTYWLLGSDHFKTPGGVSTPKYDSSDVEGPSCSKYGESEEVPQNAFIERRGSITYQEDE
ncbi:atrial natriuretic peptide receptor 2 [Lingula anatina]|uniref:guanylate cyclase n=1 Tax=Lingula anatina TaxID=7574 RepID=A0A2R2MNZ5_LINAN|nr:atrial natriuretic peptide receptor 2 [Lingula anatina]|eukprot:XP_023931944.1 atrial natriuretic peptide receptor 2 [Lingula anatina]